MHWIFEYISVDIIISNKQGVRGFKYTALYVDKCTAEVFPYNMKAKSELLHTFQKLISEYGPERHPRCVHLRYLQRDSGSESLSAEFKAFLQQNNIQLLTSSPYKHEQVLVERYIGIVKNGLRTTMAYNNAPVGYWCYAMEYYCETFNNLPRMNSYLFRNELFYGTKPDISKRVLPCDC